MHSLRNSLGESMRFAGDMMLHEVNNAGLLPGYRLRILYEDEGCNAVMADTILQTNLIKGHYISYPEAPHVDADGDGQVTVRDGENRTVHLGAADVRPVGLVGCGCSVASMRVARLVYNFRLHMVSPLSSNNDLSDRSLFPNFFRTITHDSFFAEAACAAVKLFGFSRLSVVVHDLGALSSYAAAFVAAAEKYNVQLLGEDLSSDVSGLHGLLLFQFWGEATRVALELKRLGSRLAAGLMIEKSLWLVLCAQVHTGVSALVWLTGFLNADLWRIDDFGRPAVGAPSCSKEEIVGAASGLVGLATNVWRHDSDKPLTCSSNMTAADFRQEYYVRQGLEVGEFGTTRDGYPVFMESPAIADAICMFSLMLREMLLVRGHSIAELESRSEAIFEEGFSVLSASDFSGVMGQVRFEPGSADSTAGSIVMMQLRTPYSPCIGASECGRADGAEYVRVAVFQEGTFHFAAEAQLLFHYEDEAYSLPPASAEDLWLPDFQACGEGEEWDPRLRRCTACPEEMVFVRDLGGCVCARGSRKFNSTCLPCTPGRFSSMDSASACTACPEGSFAGSPGQSDCQACLVGTYASTIGSSACTSCGSNRRAPELWTTMRNVTTRGRVEWAYAEGSTNSAPCGCDRQARKDSEGECIPCGEGLKCSGMDIVVVLPGYNSEPDFSIFRCYQDPRNCKGGQPGDTCNDGRWGIACAECEAGKAPRSDGTCGLCGGAEVAPFILVCLLTVLCLCACYHVMGTAMSHARSSGVLTLFIHLGQLLTAVQILGVVSKVPAFWQDPFGAAVALLALLNFDLVFFRLDCVSYLSPLGRFIMTLMAIVLIIALVVSVHCLSVLVWHKGDFRTRAFALKSTVGSILMIFCISVVSAVLSPLQCEMHPNQKWTMRQYEGVLCWESSTHTGMVFSGLLALILIPLPHVVKSAAIVHEFPARMRKADIGFLREYGFLFARSRPEVYWHVLVHFGRSLCIALVVILPGSVLQLVSLQILMCTSVAFAATYRPWRSDVANTLEVCVTCLVMFLCVLASFFGDASESELARLSSFCFVLLIAILTPALVLLLHQIARKYLLPPPRYQFFLCHHKAGAGAFTRLLKMSLVECPKVHKDVFVDSDDLQNLNILFETVRERTDTLVVIATRQIFQRPWCVGEMTTARLCKVDTVIVALPDAELPDTSTINDFGEKVPGLECLIAENISMEDIRETLQWSRTLRTIELPDLMSKGAVVDLVCKLCGSREVSRIETSATEKEHKSFILYDPVDMEAIAAAWVLQKMLAPHFLARQSELPTPLDLNQELSPNGENLVVLLSAGFLQEAYCLNKLLSAAMKGMRILPVTLQDTFRFPSSSDLEELEAIGSDVANVVRGVLREISVSFQPQHAPLQTLRLGAEQVADRLLKGCVQHIQSRSTVCDPTLCLAEADWTANEDVTPVMQCKH